MTPPDWQTKIENELQLAWKARAQGNEGRARVGARRAAGWAIQQFLKREGVELETPSAYEYIQHLRKRDGLPPRWRSVLDHLVTKVEKDSREGEAYWPLDADLLAETRWLVEQLLGVQLNVESDQRES